MKFKLTIMGEDGGPLYIETDKFAYSDHSIWRGSDCIRKGSRFYALGMDWRVTQSPAEIAAMVLGCELPAGGRIAIDSFPPPDNDKLQRIVTESVNLWKACRNRDNRIDWEDRINTVLDRIEKGA